VSGFLSVSSSLLLSGDYRHTCYELRRHALCVVCIYRGAVLLVIITVAVISASVFWLYIHHDVSATFRLIFSAANIESVESQCRMCALVFLTTLFRDNTGFFCLCHPTASAKAWLCFRAVRLGIRSFVRSFVRPVVYCYHGFWWSPWTVLISKNDRQYSLAPRS